MTPTQSPTLASQATAELPKLPEPLDPCTEPGYTADQVQAYGLACYEAGRASRAQSEWQPIETAPKYKEVLLWRADAGSFTGIFTSAEQFLSDRDQERLALEDLELEDWFGGDYRGSWRLDGDEKPTHWMPLPAPATLGETK